MSPYARFEETVLDSRRERYSAFVLNVARVERRHRFKKQHVDFTHPDRLMFHAARNDEKLAGIEAHYVVSKVDLEMPVQDEGQLVLVLVAVPDELTLKFHELDLLTVELADYSGTPVLCELRQFLGQIDLLHRY
jgi:hypothetical protein